MKFFILAITVLNVTAAQAGTVLEDFISVTSTISSGGGTAVEIESQKKKLEMEFAVKMAKARQQFEKEYLEKRKAAIKEILAGLQKDMDYTSSIIKQIAPHRSYYFNLLLVIESELKKQGIVSVQIDYVSKAQTEELVTLAKIAKELNEGSKTIFPQASAELPVQAADLKELQKFVENTVQSYMRFESLNMKLQTYLQNLKTDYATYDAVLAGLWY